jgi:hypothetical protein
MTKIYLCGELLLIGRDRALDEYISSQNEYFY